ncbi:MAG: permease [Clostridiaceae bacterium]|nr:permease [Clostridiaceae bacterium]
MLILFSLLIVFVIAAIGYLVGSMKIAGLQLGTSGVLLVALVFGHFGYTVPSLVKDLGLACFVGAVGFIAGPVFFRGFKKQAADYVLLGFVIITVGTVTTMSAIALFGLPTPLGIGIMSGALTSTPGLAAAIEATGSDLASVGYGIAYPFGVVGVVLFIQLIPKLASYNMASETKALIQQYEGTQGNGRSDAKKLIVLDVSGMLPLTVAMVIGLVIGQITVPLPGGTSFSLGTSGGPLLAGLLFGHFGQVAGISLEVPKKSLETLRELGLMLFLIGAGTGAGSGFLEVIKEHGVGLFLIGAVITLLPMIIGYIIARRAFKLSLLNSLGSICGGMTSTPALGTLITVAGTDHVAAAYAATYPVALICVVLACQIVALVM